MPLHAASDEKSDPVEPELGRSSESHGKGEIAHIDALATAANTTLESFSHLDEKKVLRKVCHPSQMQISMLALA